MPAMSESKWRGKRRTLTVGGLARLGAVGVVATLLGMLAFFSYAAWQYAHAFTHVGCIGERTSLERRAFRRWAPSAT